MEQQKILWIMLAVAVLIMAVLGGAFFIFSPIGDQEIVSKVETRDSVSDRFDPVEWAKSGEEYPGVTESEVDLSTDSTDFVIYGEAGNTDEVFSEETSSVVDKILQQEEAVAVAPVSPAPMKKVTPAPVVPKKSVAVAKPKPVPVAKPVPMTTKIVNEYWIQTAAPTSLVGAEQAKKVLSDKGFPSTIQTKTIDGRVFYRVRVGAYLTKAEAEKFLAWIKEMKGFEESYISVVKAKRQT